MNCPHCSNPLPSEGAIVCPSCGQALTASRDDSAKNASPPVRLNWLVFFAVLLAPPLLTILAVQVGSNSNGLAVAIALLGGGLGGIISGAMLGRRLGKTTGTRMVLGLVFALALSVTCIGMSCFGCLAGGFKMDFR